MSAPVCTIAVIVPVHNAAKYLPDCLDAIAAQQFDAFCCVLVDDGSRDDRRHILAYSSGCLW